MNRFLLFILFLFTLKCYSQTVEIVKTGTIEGLPEGKIFAFIEPATNINSMQFVGTFSAKVKNKKEAIEMLYFAIRKKATKLGANCYKINSFTRGPGKNECELILDAYYASDESIAENTNNHEKNVIYIFGKEREGDKSVSININGKSTEIKAGYYLKLELNEGEELKLNKGGSIGGATAWITWEKDMQPLFYTLTGFGLSSISEQPVNGIAFNTGRINKIVNASVGFLFTKLLKEATEEISER